MGRREVRTDACVGDSGIRYSHQGGKRLSGWLSKNAPVLQVRSRYIEIIA